MLFNSFDFAIFLPLVFMAFWFLNKFDLKWQNALIVLSSYVFYGFWDYRFLLLIFFSSIVDYSIGLLLAETNNRKRKKLLLLLSLLVNLGFLFSFKYFNFFLDNIGTISSFLGHQISFRGLDLILPVGISFYTFQTLSYTIDIYQEKIKPTKDLVSFLAFVSFFPQLVAGPIERASHLLPQFKLKKKFNLSLASDGMRQILWGLFKKMVIGDNCALLVNPLFENPAAYSSLDLFLGAILFSFQIYCDFSGYSDIAIGTAKLFGFDLMQNFKFPYFSRNIAEFWRRWHISLTTWFRDYVYIPLGGSKKGLKRTIINTILVFLISGFWHGAKWTFIIWGIIHALLFIPLLVTKINRKYVIIDSKGGWQKQTKEAFYIVGTFCLVSLSWIIFRAESMTIAYQYFDGIFNFRLKGIDSLPLSQSPLEKLLPFFILTEWFSRDKGHALQDLFIKRRRILRYSFYSLLVFLIFMHSPFNNSPFIYFQF